MGKQFSRLTADRNEAALQKNLHRYCERTLELGATRAMIAAAKDIPVDHRDRSVGVWPADAGNDLLQGRSQRPPRRFTLLQAGFRGPGVRGSINQSRELNADVSPPHPIGLRARVRLVLGCRHRHSFDLCCRKCRRSSDRRNCPLDSTNRNRLPRARGSGLLDLPSALPH